MRLQGDADNRPLVKSIAETVMERIRALSQESKQRLYHGLAATDHRWPASR